MDSTATITYDLLSPCLLLQLPPPPEPMMLMYVVCEIKLCLWKRPTNQLTIYNLTKYSTVKSNNTVEGLSLYHKHLCLVFSNYIFSLSCRHLQPSSTRCARSLFFKGGIVVLADVSLLRLKQQSLHLWVIFLHQSSTGQEAKQAKLFTICLIIWQVINKPTI